MVSNNGPPLPMPMQVAPGHMVQQIVDEHGILTHVILSPQPTSMPVGGPSMTVGYYVCIQIFFPSSVAQAYIHGNLHAAWWTRLVLFTLQQKEGLHCVKPHLEVCFTGRQQSILLTLDTKQCNNGNCMYDASTHYDKLSLLGTKNTERVIW